MIRKDNLDDVSDEQYTFITKPFYDTLHAFNERCIYNPFIGFYLTMKFFMSAMRPSSLEQHISSGNWRTMWRFR